MRITIWNEYVHERKDPDVGAVYPEGIHGCLASELGSGNDWTIRTATMDEPENGLPDSVLDQTDVLLWWGHVAHGDVSDETAERVQTAVLRGMGLVVLHSGHHSKPFKRLMGTSCSLTWREDGMHERVWVVDATHPIAAGIEGSFVVPQTEMYGEYFDVPNPDELVFVSWYPGGEVFRSGQVWKRGRGMVFYFSPGHETYPIYRQPEVVSVIRNGCEYVSPRPTANVQGIVECPNVKVSPESKLAQTK